MRKVLSTIAILLLIPSILFCKHHIDSESELNAKKSSEEYNLQSYVEECRKELGEIPTFNCLDGEVVPVYDSDNNREVTFDNHLGAKQKCDRPSHLRTDRINYWGGFNPCVPGTRLGRSNPSGNFKTEWVWSCRRYFPRNKQSSRFDDINMIGHNPETGATCFFVSKINRDPPTESKDLGHSFGQVPSPASPEGKNLWKSPREMTEVSAFRGGSQPCVDCHDNDPFIHTPFFHQVRKNGESILPSNPDGKYYIVGSKYHRTEAWEVKTLVSPEAATCTSCHRIGSRRTCSDLAMLASGMQSGDYLTKKFDKNAWMPQMASNDWDKPITNHNKTVLSVEEQKAVKFINKCCSNPDSEECKWQKLSPR